MFAPPYVYDETTVETSVETEPFKTIGRTVKQRGWKAILATTTPKVKKRRFACFAEVATARTGCCHLSR